MAKNKSGLSSEDDSLGLRGFLSFLILHELNLSSLCGDDLSKRIGKRKGSDLTPGTIYPALKRLRKAKLLSYRRHGRKKVYALTDAGNHEISRLYFLFGNYFYGLKDKLPRVPLVAQKSDNKKNVSSKKV
ncbi:PadR family transcriptional regulator [Candidatus Woesearchaeota archaeon]|nr:PadR family transcriptional regulator [Candidatus Woesearchaeota archaeon]